MTTWNLPEQDTEAARKAACEQYLAAQKRHTTWLLTTRKAPDTSAGNAHLLALGLLSCARRAEMCEPST
jgi:hypothetical protein